MSNCTKCKDILKMHNDTLCDACLLGIIQANRPSFIAEESRNKNYAQIIKENYIFDKENLVYVKKT